MLFAGLRSRSRHGRTRPPERPLRRRPCEGPPVAAWRPRSRRAGGRRLSSCHQPASPQPRPPPYLGNELEEGVGVESSNRQSYEVEEQPLVKGLLHEGHHAGSHQRAQGDDGDAEEPVTPDCGVPTHPRKRDGGREISVGEGGGRKESTPRGEREKKKTFISDCFHWRRRGGPGPSSAGAAPRGGTGGGAPSGRPGRRRDARRFGPEPRRAAAPTAPRSSVLSPGPPGQQRARRCVPRSVVELERSAESLVVCGAPCAAPQRPGCGAAAVQSAS